MTWCTRLLSLFILFFSFSLQAAPLTQIEKNLRGAWYNESTSGQGVLVDLVQTSGNNVLFASWYTYTKDGTQKLWLSFQGESNPNSTTQNIPIYLVGQNGSFNQPPDVTSSIRQVGTATFDISDPNNLRINYTFSENTASSPWNPSGTMNLVKIPFTNPALLNTNEAGIIGTWFDPQTAGQGLQVYLFADNKTIFATWFTYSRDRSQKLWIAMQGIANPNGSHLVDIYVTNNGRFDQPPAVGTRKVGVGTIILNNINSLTVNFAFDVAGPWGITQGSMNLVRLGNSQVDVNLGNIINTQNRDEVINAYRTRARAPTPAMQWTGNVQSCVAGTTSNEYKQRIIDQVNYFRGMAGLSAVRLRSNSSIFQSAALIMEASGVMVHNPDPSLRCFSQDGLLGSQQGLQVGASGHGAINIYIDDPGAHNTAIAHRRAILFPGQSEMATGDTPRYNSLGAIVATVGGQSTKEFVAWPPAGYVPHRVMPTVSNRWSLGLAGANFAQAQVAMRNVTTGESYTIETEPYNQNYFDNTLVWKPLGFQYYTMSSFPSQDQNIEVTVSNVIINGQARTFRYNVIMINAD